MRTLALTLVALAAITVPVQTVDAQEVSSGPVLLTSGPFTWIKGDVSWMSLNWTSYDNIENVAITADTSEPGVVVKYPDEGAGFTSLAGDEALLSHELDSSQLSLQVGEQTSPTFDLAVTMTFTINGVEATETFTLGINVIDPAVSDGLLETTEVTINPRGTADAGWIELRYIGLGSIELHNLRATVSTDLNIEHPQGSYTGLHHDEQLSPGERDVARVWIDPSQLVSGSIHELTVLTQYRTPDGEDWISEETAVILRVT